MRGSQTLRRWWKSLKKEDQPGRGQILFRLTFDLALGFLIGLLINQIPAAHTLGRNALEAFQVFDPEEPSQHVVLVNVSPATFEKVFENRSPLVPEKLFTLLCNIALQKPLLIGVDIDTSHPDFKRMYELACPPGGSSPSEQAPVQSYETLLEEGIHGVPVVWARGGICGGDDCAKGQFTLGSVLAQNPDADHSSRAGVAVFKREPDGTVREFTRCVDAYIEGTLYPYPTFHWAIVSSIVGEKPPPTVASHHNPCRAGGADPTDYRKLVIPWVRYQFPELDADNLLLDPPVTPSPGEERSDIFHNAVVLVGGSYDQRDRHLTAFGSVDGYRLLARAVEAELRGELKQRDSFLGVGLVLTLFLGGIATSCHFFFRPWFAVLLGGAAMTLVPVALSLWLFVSRDLWLDWAPFLLGFWLSAAYTDDLRDQIASMLFPRPTEAVFEERSEWSIKQTAGGDGGGTHVVSLNRWRRWRGRVLGPRS